jgi:hypothetical protein
MDFNINLFTSPYDQYHIGPNLVPYTSNIGYSDIIKENNAEGYRNKIENFDNPNNLNVLNSSTNLNNSSNINNSSNLNNSSNINNMKSNFIEQLNKSRLDNNRLLTSSDIINPTQMSNLNIINNQPSYGFNRSVGQWLPDYNLEDQIKKENNRNKKEYVDGNHITNANFGNYSRSKYHFPFILSDAERILNLNSDGLAKSLNATTNELNYGYGKASGSTDVVATHPITKNGAILSNGTKEGLINCQCDSCMNNCQCDSCMNNYQCDSCKKKRKEKFEIENINKKLIELFNNNNFLWFMIVILLFICICQYNDNKKIINELINIKKNNTPKL